MHLTEKVAPPPDLAAGRGQRSETACLSRFCPKKQRRYGRFTGEPAPAQFARYFYLTEQNLDWFAAAVRHNHLSFAVQLCSVRFLGTFITNIAAILASVVAHLVQQLDIEDHWPSTPRRDNTQ